MPLSDFTADVVYGPSPLGVRFTYTGSGGRTFLWQYNAGSGWITFSNTGSAWYEFPTGTYSVRLLVKSQTDSDCSTKPQLIKSAAIAHSSSLRH